MQISYRPPRIGLLVSQGELSELLEAVQLNTILWGGIYNPIIPVGDDSALAHAMVSAFAVDLLYCVSHAKRVEDFASLHPWIEWTTAFPYARTLTSGRRQRPVVPDILPLIQENWERHLGLGSSSYALVTWAPDATLRAYYATTFGSYPSLETDYTAAFVRGLAARTLTAGVDASADELFESTSPIDLTGHNLAFFRPRFLGTDCHGVYIGDACSPRDLTDFWNLRAAGLDVEFYPVVGDRHVQRFVARSRMELWAALQNEGDFPYLGVWRGADVTPERAKKLAAEVCPVDASLLVHTADASVWSREEILPATHRDSSTVTASVDEFQDKRPAITLVLPPKPLPDHSSISPQTCWMVDIHPLGEHGYDGYTLLPPAPQNLRELFRKIHPAYRVRVSGDSLNVLMPIDSATLTLLPASRQDVVTALLRGAGLAATVQQPGRIASRLIQQMGGLEACRVFKIPGVRALIENKEASKGIKRGTIKRLIEDGSFDAHRRLYIEPREKETLDSNDVIDYLLKKGVLRPGLSICCNNCELDFWLPVGELQDKCICEYCGYPVPLGPHLRGRGDWKFRLSGLFAREDHQEGSIPVVLTLLQLLRMHMASTAFVYATALKLQSDSFGAETDLVVVGRGLNQEPEIMIGECKTHSLIKEDQVSRLLKARAALVESGLACSLLFAKTSEHFEEPELDVFKSISRQGVPLVLFTKEELEPYHPNAEHRLANQLPVRYAHTFGEMAENSASIYLG